MLKTVYNQKYYQVHAMLKKPEFIKEIQWLKDRFEHFDIPIPENGFKKYQEYLDWNERFWNKVTESRKSNEFIEAVDALKDENGKIIGWDKINKKNKIEETLLPPIYGAFLKDLMQKHGFDRSDKELKKFLISYIFMGQKEFKEQPLKIVHKIDSKTRKPGLFVEIFPWTTKEDINRCWSDIKEEQRMYDEYIERNKPWEEFDRDVEIHETYKKSLQKVKNDNIKAADIDVFSELHEKYPDITLLNIRKICERTKERLGEMDT